MPGRPKSKTKQRQIKVEINEQWYEHAVKVYKAGQETEGKDRIGLRAVCERVEQECWENTKERIHLDRSTLQRRVKGGQSISSFNAEKSWLTAQEAEEVVVYAINLADRGFPLSHQRIKEHVNEICRAKLGDEFPEDGVGENWSKRFTEKHSDRLKPYWSRALDHSRARAVNPATKEAYYSLLKKTIEGEEDEEPIPHELMYWSDETGIQQGIGVKERVFGGAGKGVQHQIRSGDRENITVIETICADGTCIPPAVIFKGEGYQVSWKQNNPLNAS
jgi:hypothetical protein